ncbi:hypothetical protein ACIRPQ_29445 [Streptomyces sp. NPDC101213]|uniref:hypothetical protein n=1 Tax=Streptomyces sp. NPDC101213 TaxID=3366130 RepID=UPI00381B4E1A
MAAVIYARDFHPIATDPHRDRWTAPAMEAVTQALQGRRVAIEVDKGTGSTHMGITLHGTVNGKVLIKSENDPHGTMYSLYQIGMILPYEDKITDDTKGNALRIYRDRKSQAIRAAAAHMEERDGRNYGRMTAQGGIEADDFTVCYEPIVNAPADRTPGSAYAVRVAQNKQTGTWAVYGILSDSTRTDERRRAREERRQRREQGLPPLPAPRSVARSRSRY